MAFKDINWQPGVDRWVIAAFTVTDPEHGGSDLRDPTYATNPGATPTIRVCDRPNGPNGIGVFATVDFMPLIVACQWKPPVIGFEESQGDAYATMTMVNCRYPFQQKATDPPEETYEYQVKLSQLLRNYIFMGASCTISVVVEQPQGTQVAQQVFFGIIYDVDGDEDRFNVSFRSVEKRFVRLKPDSDGPVNATSSTRMIVNRTDYPNAPADSIGRSLPMTYTNRVNTIEAIDGLAMNPTNMDALSVPVIIDASYTASGGRAAVLNLSSFPSQHQPNPTTYVFFYVSEVGTLARMMNSGTGGSTDGYHHDWWITTMPEIDSYADVYLNPTLFVAASAAVADSAKAFDGRKDTYAQMVCTGANITMDLRVPYISPLGVITGSKAFIILQSGGTTLGPDADGVVYGDFGMWNADAGPPDYHFTRSGNITKARVRDGGYYEATAMSSAEYGHNRWRNWQWEGGTADGTRQDIYFRARLLTATANGVTARVAACGLKVSFLPRNLTSVSPRRTFDQRTVKG